MPIAEDVCWKILRRAQGESISSKWLKGDHSKDPPIENAIPLFVLEHELVLHYTKSTIEDSLYFLEKRGYLVRHGYPGLTRVAFQLSDAGVAALASGTFMEEEQAAFREALVDAKRPEFWGIRFNLAEVFRRARKRFRIKP